MKKSTKIALILAVCGVGCCVAAGIMGVGSVLKQGVQLGISAAESQEPTQQQVLDVQGDKIAVELDLDYSKVTIQAGDSWHLSCGSDVHSYTEGNTLKIEQEKNRPILKWKEPTPVVLTVPNEALLSMEIDLDAGSVDMSGISLPGMLQCSVDAGRVHMTDMTVSGGCTLDCDAGQIDFSGIVHGRTDIECDVGEIRMDLQPGSTIGRVQGDADLGTCHILIDGKSYVNQDTLSESIAAELPHMPGNDLLTVDCDAGAVTVSLYSKAS